MKKLTSLLTALTMIGGMAFAVSAEETSFALGDVDMDGVITGHDTAMVSYYVTGGDITLTEEQLRLADVDGDGAVTQADADKLYNEMQEYDLGDIDLDGYAEISDASIAYHMLKVRRIKHETDFGAKGIRADVNFDGVIDIYDAYTILKAYSRDMTMLSDQIFTEGTYCYRFTKEDEQSVVDEFNDVHKDIQVTSLAEIEDYRFDIKTFDVNGDGELTISDASDILRIYAEDMAGTGIYKASADINKKADLNLDGEIDIDDATLALKAYAMSVAGLI